MNSVRSRTPVPILIACALWLSIIASVMIVLTRTSNTPGGSGAVSGHWPVQSAIPRDHARPTLILFVHPHCPCSRATIGELELLLTRCTGRLTTHVLFIRPARMTHDWVKTDLWHRASAFPGVAVHSDDGGVESRRFGPKTSGHAMLFNTDGQLMFEGGITGGRGHSGDNPGRTALMALLENKPALQIKTPVFGCPLFGME